MKDTIKIVKLPMKWTTPTQQEVAELVHQAQNASSVEQQWASGNSDETFVLSCRAQNLEEPQWIFAVGGMKGFSVKWQHATCDVSLIYSFIMSDIAGVTVEQPISGIATTMASQVNLSTLTSPAEDNADSAASKEDSAGKARRDQSSEARPAPNVSADTKEKSESMLQGDLSMVQMPSLLQSVRMSKMTGRLFVNNDQTGASVFFDDGEIVHAEHGTSIGDAAVIELVAWQRGKFHFTQGERTVERTVKNRLDTLLMEGVTFADQMAYLDSKGVQLSSYLIRKNPLLKDKELRKQLDQGTPVNIKQQLSLYWQIDDCSTLLDILRIMPLKEMEWAPLLFNLLTLELIVISDQPARSKRNIQLVDQKIDAEMVENAIKGCIRPETGIFTYPALLYFIKQEFCRLDVGGMPFSLLIFQVEWLGIGGQRENLSREGEKEMIRRVRPIKREFEIFAHFETFDYALLLPQTDVKAAALVAQRIMLALRNAELFNHSPREGKTTISIGVAGLPNDGSSVGALLAAAVAAKKHAQSGRNPVVSFHTMQI